MYYNAARIYLFFFPPFFFSLKFITFLGFCFKQELTEEGLPFLILFHNTDDTDIVETYNNEVAKQLLSEKSECFYRSVVDLK